MEMCGWDAPLMLLSEDFRSDMLSNMWNHLQMPSSVNRTGDACYRHQPHLAEAYQQAPRRPPPPKKKKQKKKPRM